MSEIETGFQTFPTCPYCGFVHQDWRDGTEMKNDGDSETMVCGECEKSFTCEMCIEVSFSTEKGV